jgi:hypothetical protein
MRDLNFYKNGKPFDGPISKNMDAWRTRISKGKPAGVIICAPPGRGKTTLAVHLCREYLQQPELDIKVICDKYMGNGFKDTLAKLDKVYMEGGKIIIYDEAGDVSKRRSLSQINYEILQVINKIRGFNMFMIMIMQDFSLLDGAIITSELFRAGFYITDRKETYADYDCYSLNGLGRVRWCMSETLKHDLFKNKAFTLVEANFWGHYKNLPVSESEYLHKWSIDAKIKSFREMLDKQDGLMNMKEIASEIGRSRVWVTKNLNKLGVNHVKKRGLLKFYDSTALDYLRGEMK